MMSDITMKHRCEARFDSAQCGPAVDYCYSSSDGALWAGNGEYESMVNFCPFCGLKADVPAVNTNPPGGETWTGTEPVEPEVSVATTDI